MAIHVTVWNEYLHEKQFPEIASIYPKGIHGCIADFLQKAGMTVQTATLEEPEHGLTQDVLDNTDVLIWWGHMAHDRVPDEVAERVQQSVLKGMGAIFLHSGHHSKPFRRLMGTTCNLTWREDGDRELVWVCNPSHPIAQGVDRFIKLDHVETYGEPFDIPEPDQLVFIGNYEGGEVFRSGCCFFRGNGRIFYFQPGHESFPIFKNPQILRVITNAIHWAAPVRRVDALECPHVKKPLGCI